MEQRYKIYALQTSRKSRIGGIIVGAIFALFGALVIIGVLDLTVLQEAWRSSVLYRLVPDQKSAIVYVLVGAVIIIETLAPDKYRNPKGMKNV